MTSTETEVMARPFTSSPRCAKRSPGSADATALEELYDEHATALGRYARRLTGDPARFRDVVHKAPLRDCQHPEVGRDRPPSARSWLFTAARTLIIDESRSLRFRCEVITPDRVDANDVA